MSFDWYKQLSDGDNTIQQGDLIPNCVVPLPPKSIDKDGFLEIESKTANVIVLTQSCDLVPGQGKNGKAGIKAESIIVAPYKYLTDAVSQDATYQALLQKGDKEKIAVFLNREITSLAKGNKPGYHLLDKNDTFGLAEHLVISLRKMYILDIDYVESIIGNQKQRIRLLPPYREHLSQAFATMFMRVGLPSNVQSI